MRENLFRDVIQAVMDAHGVDDYHADIIVSILYDACEWGIEEVARYYGVRV